MKTKRFKWGDNTYEIYKPKRNKSKLAILFGFFGLLLLTPGTNWLAIPIIKLLAKFPMWMYR